MSNRQRWFAMIGASIVLIGIMMIPKTGPSNELIAHELSEETLKKTDGIFNVKTKVISRKAIAEDLVDIDVMLTMQRTAKEVPPELYARSLMKQRISGNDPGTNFMVTALKAPAGFIFPPEKKTFRYKRVGEQWQKTP